MRGPALGTGDMLVIMRKVEATSSVAVTACSGTELAAAAAREQVATTGADFIVAAQACVQC